MAWPSFWRVIDSKGIATNNPLMVCDKCWKVFNFQDGHKCELHNLIPASWKIQ
jgi:hypothetical protein